MFELQDSKGNRFRLSRGGQSQEHAALALEGNPLQVKRLLKFCESIALVRAYSFFYRSHSKSKKADGNATHAKRHRNTLLITRGNSQSITASNIPKAQRPSTRIPTPEERLFKAIASGELHLAQTHKVEAFNVTRAEKELGLTRSKLLSDCNALILEKKRLASRGQASLWGLVASSNAQNELKGQGARARIITLNYQRFCASLPNVKKVDGARDLQSTTGNQGSAEIQARDMLKALGFSTTKVTTSQFQRAQQQLEQIWKSKNLYKQAREFSSDYAKTQKSTEKAAEKDLATYELTLTLLLCHDQPIHALASPAPEQINLFSRYKTLGRGFWKAAETARAIEAERETIAGRATAAKFDDLAAADNEERERNTPPATLTFIEITLLDDKGEPIANEPYWVLDPEGNEHTGNLDGSGFARIDNIKPGNCQVAFPEIEGSGISQCRADVDCCTPAEEPVYAGSTARPADDSAQQESAEAANDGNDESTENADITTAQASETQEEPEPDNFVNASYYYADGTGVEAQYTVYKQGTTDVVTEGKMPSSGETKIALPADIDAVEVKFHSDPPEITVIKESAPQTPTAPPGWFDRMKSGISSAWESTTDGLNWAWGVVQGDFNENPSAAQIITNAVITMIPVVDQVADARDIVANAKLLVWDKRYNEVAVWFALFITLIGLIPVLGSALKGVLKLVWKGAKLDEVLKVFNYFMKGNGVKWLKELQAGKLSEYAQQAAQTGHQVFDAIKVKIVDIQSLIPSSFTSAHSQIKDLLATLQAVKGQINQRFEDIATTLSDKIGAMLKEAGEASGEKATAKGSVSKTQEASPPPSDSPTRFDASASSSTTHRKELKVYPNAKSVDELIDEKLDWSNSLNGLEGEEFKRHVLIDYHLDPEFEEITRDEFLSLAVYTTDLYGPINSGMRGLSDADLEEWSRVAKDADTALAKLAKNEDRIFKGTVYRGDDLSDELIEELFPDNGIHIEKAFKSTSSNSNKSFPGNVKLTIKSKNGISVNDISVAPNEEEVLFRPGTSFKVISKEKFGDITHIELEEL